MEKWAEIRRRVLNDEISKRAACAEYEIHWETLQKILTHTEPPGYRRRKPPRKSKLEAFLPIIHEILESDRKVHRKQRHTAKRIFERLDGELTKVAMFVMTLPFSDAIFCQVFPRECTEAFLEGHKRAFEFFGGIPQRISDDNSKIAVGRIVGSREREVTQEFLRLKSHYLFDDHFCLVRRPNEKGHVEHGLVVACPLRQQQLLGADEVCVSADHRGGHGR